MSEAARVVFAVLFIGLALIISIPIYDAVVSAESETFTQDSRVDDTVNIEGQTGSFVKVRNSQFGENETVRDSRGHAIRLTGADDSFVESDSSFSFASDGNWTVATWARVNSSASGDNMTAVSLNGRVLIQYNGSQSNWSVWYFDEGSRDSWRANVSAPNQPSNLSLVVAQHNGTHLTIYRNSTQGDVVNTSGSNIEEVDVDSTNWNGDIDETRTFDDALNSSQRSHLENAPVKPLANATRTARLMYDAGSGTHINIYFASTDGTGSNITYVDGLDGNDLTKDTLLVSGDYDWQKNGPKVKAVSGGSVDGAPVLFAEYDLTDSEGLTLRNVAENLELVGVIFIALIAGVVLGVVRRFQ